MQDCLTVAEKDKYGNFKTTDNDKVILRIKGESLDEELRNIFCKFVEFEESKESLAEVCPYHRPGGLKEKWDTVGKQQYEAKKRKEAKKAQNEKDKEERKRDDGEGCVVQ